MRKTGGLVTVLAAMIILLGGHFFTMSADQPEVFKFKYKNGVVQEFRMKMKMDIDMKMFMSGRNINNRIIVDMMWNIKLDPKNSTGDMTRVVLMPDKPQMKMEIKGMVNLKGTVKDGHVYVTQNGIAVIDTKKGIGKDKAKEFTKDLKALSMTGEMDLSADGRKVLFHGSREFKKFWEDAMESQVGFFSIFFPQRAVAVGDTYSETLTLKKMGQVILEGKGLVGKISVTREADKMINGKRIGVFKLSSPLNASNLVGSMPTFPGARVNIKNIKRNAKGFTHFDNIKGELVRSFIEADADIRMSLSMVGQSGSMDMKLELAMDIEKL